jgi:hypothetical protein
MLREKKNTYWPETAYSEEMSDDIHFSFSSYTFCCHNVPGRKGSFYFDDLERLYIEYFIKYFPYAFNSPFA